MIKRMVALGGASLVAATAGMLGASAPADAASIAHGKVNAKGGVVVRDAPSRYAGKVTTFANGTTFSIWCKVHGTTVDGNDLWYLNAGEGVAWVPARYVTNVGKAPAYCNVGDGATAKVKATTNIRKGPNTADAKTGSYTKGTKVTVICVVEAQRIGKSLDWFYTSKGRWVTGANVTVSERVRYCAF